MHLMISTLNWIRFHFPQSLRHPSHVRRVVVVLLTGQKLEAMVDPAITAQQMFESVITHIELPEFFFFGLTYINGNYKTEQNFHRTFRI